MNQQMRPFQSEEIVSLPTVPSMVISMEGQKVDATTDEWRIRRSADGGVIEFINCTTANKLILSHMEGRQNRYHKS